jgi:hypothetical protein
VPRETDRQQVADAPIINLLVEAETEAFRDVLDHGPDSDSDLDFDDDTTDFDLTGAVRYVHLFFIFSNTLLYFLPKRHSQLIHLPAVTF